MRLTRFFAFLLVPLAATFLAAQERTKKEAPAEEAKPKEELFSGPQVGEKLPSFKVQGVLGNEGKDLDFLKQADGKPIVLVFVHDVNRPSIGLTRVLTSYTASRAKDGLTTGVAFLSDDATEAEANIKRMQHALTAAAPTGIAEGGKEGPGSYGLNRKVTLTILVGKEGKVTANFALVQPSLQADLPKILKEIVAVAGGKVPKLEEIAGTPEMRRDPKGEPDQALRDLLRPVIKLDAKPEDVDAAAAAVEKYVEKNEAARKEVGRIASTIIDAGKLSSYGTPRAQEHLRKWAKDFGAPSKEPKK
ncbi:MAG: hypothetical protein ACKVP0_05390 [Pirellulaceae bacterium]